MLYHGTASFVDPHTVRVESGPRGGHGHRHPSAGGAEVLLRGDTILIATGSSPVRPAAVPVRARPRARLRRDAPARAAAPVDGRRRGRGHRLRVRLHVRRAGHRRSGSSTAATSCCRSWTTRSPRRWKRAMRRQLGIEFLWKNQVTGCEAHEDGDITLESNRRHGSCVDAVLVAAGRSSNTAGLDLAAAGLEPGPRGLLDRRRALPHRRAAHLRRRRRDRLPRAGLHQRWSRRRVAMCHAFQPGSKTELAPSCPPASTRSPRSPWSARPRRTCKAQGVDYVVGRASLRRLRPRRDHRRHRPAS